MPEKTRSDENLRAGGGVYLSRRWAEVRDRQDGGRGEQETVQILMSVLEGDSRSSGNRGEVEEWRNGVDSLKSVEEKSHSRCSGDGRKRDNHGNRSSRAVPLAEVMGEWVGSPPFWEAECFSPTAGPRHEKGRQVWLGKLTKCREAPSSGVIRHQGNGEKVQSRGKGGGLPLWNWKNTQEKGSQNLGQRKGIQIREVTWEQIFVPRESNLEQWQGRATRQKDCLGIPKIKSSSHFVTRKTSASAKEETVACIDCLVKGILAHGIGPQWTAGSWDPSPIPPK